MAHTRTVIFERPNTDTNWYCIWDITPTNVKDVVTSYVDSGKIIEYSFSGEDTTTMISIIKYSVESNETEFLSESVISSFRTSRDNYNLTNNITSTNRIS